MASIEELIDRWQTKRREDNEFINRFESNTYNNITFNNSTPGISARIVTDDYLSYMECIPFNINTNLEIKLTTGTNYSILDKQWYMISDYPYGISINRDNGIVSGSMIMFDMQVDVYGKHGSNYRLNMNGSNWMNSPRYAFGHRKTYTCETVVCVTVEVETTTTITSSRSSNSSSSSDSNNTSTDTTTTTRDTYRFTIHKNIPIELRRNNDIDNVVFLTQYVNGNQDIIICRDESVLTLPRQCPVNGVYYGKDQLDTLLTVHPGPFQKCSFSN